MWTRWRENRLIGQRGPSTCPHGTKPKAHLFKHIDVCAHRCFTDASSTRQISNRCFVASSGFKEDLTITDHLVIQTLHVMYNNINNLNAYCGNFFLLFDYECFWLYCRDYFMDCAPVVFYILKVLTDPAVWKPYWGSTNTPQQRENTSTGKLTSCRDNKPITQCFYPRVSRQIRSHLMSWHRHTKSEV